MTTEVRRERSRTQFAFFRYAASQRPKARLPNQITPGKWTCTSLHDHFHPRASIAAVISARALAPRTAISDRSLNAWLYMAISRG